MTTQPRDRGLANGLIAFVIMLAAAALLYTLMDPAAVQIFDTVTSQTSNQTAQDAIDTRKQIWDLLLYYAVFLSGIMLLARAVFESRRPG